MLERWIADSAVSAGSPEDRLNTPPSSDALRCEQLKGELAEFDRGRRYERRLKLLRQVVTLWPVVAGLILGCLAPELWKLVAPLGPWGMWTVFPFAIIAARPEWHVSGQIAQALPLAAMYAQFPIEGLLVRRILRHHVTLPEVARETFFFHFLGATELCLASGSLIPFFLR